MTRLAVIAALTSFAGLGSAGYTLQDDYNPSNFFSKFNFFTGNDPTHGYVDFVSQSAAQGAGLINTNDNKVYMGVDFNNIASGRGRQSVRLESKNSYTHGLIVLDLDHMPGGICGAWPAFWTLGPNWPGSGEIDIIEGVNSGSSNSLTLHTASGCSISNSLTKRAANTTMDVSERDTGSTASSALFSGLVVTPNCDVNAAGQSNNAGCSINLPSANTYGTGFNAGGGGIYATEWTSDHISMWYFPSGGAPGDVLSANPNPNNWGTPAARFVKSGCDIDKYFQNHNIIFDTTFCGDWAGQVWSTDAVCSKKASTCEAYVQNNPSAFKDAFWSVKSLKVYSSDGKASPTDATNSPTSSGGKPTATIPVSNSLSAIPTSSFGAPPVSITSDKTTLLTTTQPASLQPTGSNVNTNTWSRGGRPTGGRTRTWGRRAAQPTDTPELDDATELGSSLPFTNDGSDNDVTSRVDVDDVDHNSTSTSATDAAVDFRSSPSFINKVPFDRLETGPATGNDSAPTHSHVHNHARDLDAPARNAVPVPMPIREALELTSTPARSVQLLEPLQNESAQSNIDSTAGLVPSQDDVPATNLNLPLDLDAGSGHHISRVARHLALHRRSHRGVS